MKWFIVGISVKLDKVVAFGLSDRRGEARGEGVNKRSLNGLIRKKGISLNFLKIP